MKNTAKVLFMYDEQFKDVVAVFTEDISIKNGKVWAGCFDKDSGHGGGEMAYLMDLRPATEDEFKSLKKQMEEGYGYHILTLNWRDYYAI